MRDLAASVLATDQRLPEVVGQGMKTTLYDGRCVSVTQLNNAATTPPFRKTLEAVEDFFATYGALHRGAGPRARLTVEKVERALTSIRAFLNATEDHALLFTQNTSAAINLFARVLSLQKGDVVLTSAMEHTSNSLPWAFNTNAQVVEIRGQKDGNLDYEDLERGISRFGRRVRLIAVTGACNQTGYVPDLPYLAALAQSAGVMLFVDAAQLAPHRPIDLSIGISALAFSAHKLYAPFGLGVLALPRSLLNRIPADPGGGSIDMISDHGIIWATPEFRHQTGTWNATGIVALGASCDVIREIGWQTILQHEEQLVDYMAGALSELPSVAMRVPRSKYRLDRRIGTFPLTLTGYHHSLLSAVLEHEYGIEVRSGTICNHRLVRRWFEIDDSQQRSIEEQIAAGNRLASYGIVRASLGIHNTCKDSDALASALRQISETGPRLQYRAVAHEELYEPIFPS